MRIVRGCVVLLACAGLWGCASTGQFQAYEGPERSASEHARVNAAVEKSNFKNMLGGVVVQTRISCVDGHDTSNYDANGGAPAVLLAPGRHYITVYFTTGKLLGRSTMWLDAEAGHTYDARYEQRGQYFRMWIEDQKTARVVGGYVGSEPPGSAVTNRCK
jgi:hypothetical protein